RVLTLEIFIMTNIATSFFGENFKILEGDFNINRRIRSITQTSLSTSELEAILNERVSSLLRIFGSLIRETTNGFTVNMGDEIFIFQDMAEGIVIYGGNFEAIITANEETGELTIDIPNLHGDPVKAIFSPGGILRIEAKIEGLSYSIELKQKEPIIFQRDSGNWFGEGALAKFMARTEWMINHFLVTDRYGNVVTNINGEPVSVYSMFSPEFKVSNPKEGPVASLQYVNDMLYRIILWTNNWFYFGDPNQVILGGKEAVLAERFSDALMFGLLPYPLDPVAQEATDLLYEIIGEVVGKDYQEVSFIVDALPYDLRVRLVETYNKLHSELLRSSRFTSIEQINEFITGVAVVLSSAARIGTVLHPSNTSHDHWEGFLLRTAQLLSAVMLDTRMATLSDFLNQAMRFIYGDNQVYELKRRVQLALERGQSDPLVKTYINELLSGRAIDSIIRKTESLTAASSSPGEYEEEYRKFVAEVWGEIGPIVPTPTSAGGVATMAGSDEYRNGNLRFLALLSGFLTISATFPEIWGVSLKVPPLVVGGVVCIGIYMLFSKVLVPFVGALKMGEGLHGALDVALKGLSSLSKDWENFQALTIMMPYMLAKVKLHNLARRILGDKTTWPKRMSPQLPIDSASWEAYVKLWDDFFEKKDAASFIKLFEKNMDMIVANVVVPGLALVYGYSLYRLLGPAWMWIGLPQIYGWLKFPFNLNLRQ
ncbi:MAG: hypothetical protein NC927_01200, partial [Candidatus Omnitrophica bacterium]|nr:hypothetical protein [Candidatus Omnitrophota bacterium]